jgi:hypothetical protein
MPLPALRAQWAFFRAFQLQLLATREVSAPLPKGSHDSPATALNVAGNRNTSEVVVKKYIVRLSISLIPSFLYGIKESGGRRRDSEENSAIATVQALESKVLGELHGTTGSAGRYHEW